MSAQRPSTAILYQTHFIDPVILGEYRKLKREAGVFGNVRLLYNTTETPLPRDLPADVEVFAFNAGDLRRLDYRSKDTSLSSYNVELFLLNFYRQNPAFEYYWAMEYDVRFSGDWSVLFEAFADNPADLLGTTLYRHPFNPDWVNWRSLIAPIPLSPHDMIRAFIPIYRISRRALAELDRAYRNGWGGHCEVTVPTVLAHAGMRLEDIGGEGEFTAPGNVNRFYRNTPKTRDHFPGSMTFRPVMASAGPEPNMLWHPVKIWPGMVTGRRRVIVHRLRQWLSRSRALLLPRRLGPS